MSSGARPSLRVVLPALVALTALCACTHGGGGDDPEVQCERQAYDDPDVKEQIMRANSSMSSVRIPALMAEDDLVHRATQRCLAAMGLAPLGGVEEIKRY